MFVLRRLYSKASAPNKYLKAAKIDPGIRRRKTALKTQPDDNEDFDEEQIESDFMSIDKSHKEHMDEIIAMKEREKYLIVRDKYFKEKFPNFLTWHDKEQIRFLYNSDPEEWTLERLSEGFPALPHIIMKIAKGKWSKKNVNRIQTHDKQVLKNWEDFKAGNMDHLPDSLKEHLQKFTNRTLNLEHFKYNDLDKNKTVIEKHKRIHGEFSEIINSYEKLKNKNKEEPVEENNDMRNRLITEAEELNLKSSFKDVKSKKADRTLVTLKELQATIENKADKGRELSPEERVLLKPKSSEQEENSIEVSPEKQISEIMENKHKTNDQVGFVRKTTRDVSHLIYPERIAIPRDIFKEGYTYKLNDCYYDSDGEFLYRVPGME